MRAPFQVLVIPFIQEKKKYYYALFKRADLNIWQFIAGGGKGKETPLQAAKREANEEAGIDLNAPYIQLSSFCTIPALHIKGLLWGKEIIMIPEFTFAVKLNSKKLKITPAHTKYLWLPFEKAIKKLKYDSNKSALLELDFRLKTKTLKGIKANLEIIKKFL